MLEAKTFRTLQRRAYRHTLEDGIADIVAGVYAITVGVATQKLVFVALAAAWLGTYALASRFIHEQFSSRRTGYAEVPGQPASVLLTGILASGVLTLALVAGLTLAAGKLWDLGHWPLWAPVVAGLILAGGFLHTAARSGLWRFHGYAAAAVSGSLFFWLFPFGARINPSDRLTLFLFSLGGLLIVTGIVVLVRFARTRPIVAGETGDGR